MFRLTLLRCAAKKKVFQLYCREQLLTNFSLRVLPPAERRVAVTKSFKELPAETLQDLEQRAAIEELRLEALQRAAAAFKPLTPYEFFVREQRNNPALGISTNPREREIKLLQIYETLPEKAKEALVRRAELYNAEGAKVPAAPALPIIPVIKKKEATAKPSKTSAVKRASKKKRRQKTSAKSKKAVKKGAAMPRDTEEENDKETVTKARGPVSPYAIFVKEQMTSLHHLAPKERMRVIGERWRSLTNEERERRLVAARAKIASEAAAAMTREEDATSTTAAAVTIPTVITATTTTQPESATTVFSSIALATAAPMANPPSSSGVVNATQPSSASFSSTNVKKTETTGSPAPSTPPPNSLYS